MIRHNDLKCAWIDYSSVFPGDNHPSDIDLFYWGRDQLNRPFLILGEAKHEDYGHFSEGQMNLYLALLKKVGNGMILKIRHNHYVEKSGYRIPIEECWVEEYYYLTPEYGGRWVTPEMFPSLKMVIERFRT